MRIKFTRDYTVKAKDGETYKNGQVVDLSEASAQHFINRQAAVEVKPTKADEAKKPEATKPG